MSELASEKQGQAIKTTRTIEERLTLLDKIRRLKTRGYSNVAIGVMLDLPESTIRSIISLEKENQHVTD